MRLPSNRFFISMPKVWSLPTMMPCIQSLTSHGPIDIPIRYVGDSNEQADQAPIDAQDPVPALDSSLESTYLLSDVPSFTPLAPPPRHHMPLDLARTPPPSPASPKPIDTVTLLTMSESGGEAGSEYVTCNFCCWHCRVVNNGRIPSQ